MRKKTLLGFLLLLIIGSASGFGFDRGGKVAMIELSGTITPEKSASLTSVSGITPGEVRDLNGRAVSQGADAVVYEINSGGGAVVASKEVKRSIEEMDVPTVCRLRDVAASGGYLIALGCDRIVADRSSLTGSVGVKTSYIEFAGTLDRIGAEYVNISTGSRKEIANPFMNASDSEKELLRSKIELIRQDFLTEVEEERSLSEGELENISTGEPFLGEEAERLSLVDRLGGREIAIEEAENLSGKDLDVFRVEKGPEFSFLSLLTSELGLKNVLGLGSPSFRAEIGR